MFNITTISILIIFVLIIWFFWSQKRQENYDIYEIPNVKVPSFKQHIAILFRPYDVQSMKWKFDLSNYEHVKIYAEPIYKVLKSGQMPCDRPWEEKNVQLFRKWIDTGMKP